MKYILSLAALALLAFYFTACKSSSAPQLFCDTVCLKDTIRFQGDHPLQPYVWIAPTDCRPAHIIRGHKALGASLKSEFGFESARVNPAFIRCRFRDTAYAYLLFNDCLTGRGYQVRLPFSTTGTINQRSSGINSIDPKFSLSDDMIAYTDRGNIFVEQISSGKTATMTFGKWLDIDYDALHEYIDSVHITPDRIWVKVKVDDQWKELEEKITLE